MKFQVSFKVSRFPSQPAPHKHRKQTNILGDYLDNMSLKEFFTGQRNPFAPAEVTASLLGKQPDPIPSETIDELLDELIKGKDLTADLIRMLSKVLVSYEKKVESLLNVSDERREETVKAYHSLQEGKVIKEV